MEIYKKGQGLYARVLTLVGVSLIGALAAQQVFASGRIPEGFWRYLLSILTAVVFIGPAVYLCLFNGRISDYLIETQTELRKVSWSPWNEVVGATTIVIVTVVVFGVLFFGMDDHLIVLLGQVGIYSGKVALWESWELIILIASVVLGLGAHALNRRVGSRALGLVRNVLLIVASAMIVVVPFVRKFIESN